ncbi:MAG: hypothetical protein ACLFTQ_01935 [Candidatus Aenigmatarchaeota archaeon]
MKRGVVAAIFVAVLICISSPAEADSEPENLLLNPGFEDGDEENASLWEQDDTNPLNESENVAATRVNERRRNGSWSIKQVGITGRYGRYFISDPVGIKGGEEYEFGGWSSLRKNEEDPAESFRRVLRVIWLNESKKEINTTENFRDFTVLEEWEEHKVNKTAPQEAEYVQLKVESKYEGEDGTHIYWDDMFVHELESIEETYNLNIVTECDDNGALEGVSVILENIGEKKTGKNGKVTFEDLEPGEYNYEISKDGYETVEGEVEIIDGDVEEKVVLEEKEGNGDGVPECNLSVELAGVEHVLEDGETLEYEIVVNDSEGEACVGDEDLYELHYWMEDLEGEVDYEHSGNYSDCKLDRQWTPNIDSGREVFWVRAELTETYCNDSNEENHYVKELLVVKGGKEDEDDGGEGDEEEGRENEDETERININEAGVEELTEIKHIGEERAEWIKENCDDFKALSQLTEVEGLDKGRVKDIIEEGKAYVVPPEDGGWSLGKPACGDEEEDEKDGEKKGTKFELVGYDEEVRPGEDVESELLIWNRGEENKFTARSYIYNGSTPVNEGGWTGDEKEATVDEEGLEVLSFQNTLKEEVEAGNYSFRIRAGDEEDLTQTIEVVEGGGDEEVEGETEEERVGERFELFEYDEEVKAGGRLKSLFLIWNERDEPVNFTVRSYVYKNRSVLNEGGWTGNEEFVEVQGNEKKSIEFVNRIQKDVESGNYSFRVRVENEEGRKDFTREIFVQNENNRTSELKGQEAGSSTKEEITGQVFERETPLEEIWDSLPVITEFL